MLLVPVPTACVPRIANKFWPSRPAQSDAGCKSNCCTHLLVKKKPCLLYRLLRKTTAIQKVNCRMLKRSQIQTSSLAVSSSMHTTFLHLRSACLPALQRKRFAHVCHKLCQSVHTVLVIICDVYMHRHWVHCLLFMQLHIACCR